MPQTPHLDRLPWHNNHHRLLSLSFILLLQLHKPATCDHRARGRPGSLSQPQHLRLQPWTPQELVASVMAGVAEEPPHYRSSEPVFTEVPAYAKLETPKPLKHRTSRGVDYRFRRPSVLLPPRYRHLRRTSRSGKDSTEDPVHYRVVGGSARPLEGRGSSPGRSVFGASVQNSSAKYTVSYQGTWKIPPSGRGNMTNPPSLVGNLGATINRDGVDLEMPPGVWKYPGGLPGIDYGTLERLEEEEEQQQLPGGVRSVTRKRLTSLDKVTAPPPPLSWAGAEDRRHFSYKRRKKMRRKLRQSDLFTFDQNGFVSDYTKRKKKVKEKPRNERVREEVNVAETTQEDMGETRRRAGVIDFMRDFNENGRPDGEVRRVGNIDARESRRSRSRWRMAGLSPPPHRGERDDRTMLDDRLHPLVNHLHIAPKAGRRFRGVAEHARARRGFGTRRTRVGRSSRPIQVFCKTDEGRSSRRGTGSSRLLQVPPPVGTDEGVDQQQESEGNASITAVAIHKRPRSAHAPHKGRQRRRNSSDTSPIEAKVEEGLEGGSETPHRPAKRPPRPWNNPRRPPPSSQTQRPSLRSPPGREDVQRESQSQARGRTTRERGRARGEAAEKENVGQIIIRTGEDRGKSRREAKQKTIDVIQRPTKVVDERAVARWTRRNMRTAERNVVQGGSRTHHRQSGNRNTSVTKRDAVTEKRWKREPKQIYWEGKSAIEDMIHNASDRSGKTKVDETSKREIDQERRDEERIVIERSHSSCGGEAPGEAAAAPAAASGHLNEQDGRTPTEIWDNLISRRGRFPTDATDKERRDAPASTTHALHPSFAGLPVYHGSASRVHDSPDTKVLTRSSTDPVDQLPSSSTERESNPTPRRRPSLPLTPLRKRNDNEIFTEVFREKTWGVRPVDGEERPSTEERREYLESVLGQSPLLDAVQLVIDVGRCCKGHYDKVDEWCMASAAYLPLSRNGVQVTPQILILESTDGGRCWVLSSSSSSSQDGDLGGGVRGAGGPSWCCRDSRHNEGDYGHSRPYGDSHRSENGTTPRSRSGGWTLWGCGFIIQRTSLLLPGRLSRRHATLIIIRPRDLTTLCTPVTALGGAFQQAIRTTLGRLLLLVMFLDTTVPGGSTSGSLLLGGQRTQGGPSPRMGTAQGQVDPHVTGALSGKPRVRLFTSPPAEGRRDLWKYTTSHVDLSHHKTGQEEPREADKERNVSIMASLSDNPKTHTEEDLRLAEGEAAEHRATLARYPLDHEGPTGAGTIVLGDAGGKIPTRTRPTASVNKESLPNRGEALEIVRQTFYDLQRSSDIGSNSALGMLTGRVGSGRKLDLSAGNQRNKRNVASRRRITKRITRTWKGGDNNVGVGGDMKNMRKHQRTDDNGGGTPGTKDATSTGGGRYWMVRDANREGHRWRRRRGAKRLISSNSENYGAVGSPEATVNNRSTNAFTALVRHSHRGKNSSKSGDTTARGLQVNSLGSTSHSVQGHTSTPRRVSKLPESFVESGSGHNITSAANTNPERRTPGSAPAGGVGAAAGGSAQQHLPEIFTSKKSFISYSTRPLAGESSSTSPDRPAYFPEDLPQTLEGPHLPGFKDPGERLAFDRSKFPVYDSLPGKVSEESEENRRNFRRNEGIILINENQNSSLTLASAKSIPGLNNSSTRNTSSSDGLMSNASAMNDLQKSDENGYKTTYTEATSRKTENSTEIIESNTGVDSSGRRSSESPTSPGMSLLTESVYGILQTQGASRTSPTENPVLQATRKWSSEVWDTSVSREKDHHALRKQNNAEDSKISSPRVDGAQEHFDVASSIVQYGREAGEQPSGNMGYRRKTTGNVSGSPGNEKDLESGKTGGVFTPSRWQKPGPLEWRSLPVWSPADYRTYHVGFTGRQSSSSVDRYHSVTSPGPPRLASSLEHRVPDSFPTSGLPHTHGEIPVVKEKDRENVRSFFSKTHNYQRDIAGQPRTVELSERHYQFHRPSSDLRVGLALGKAQGHVQGRLQIPPQRQPRLRLARQRQIDYQSRKGNYSQENDTRSEKRNFQNPDHLGHPRDRPLSHPQNPSSPSGNSHNPISKDASQTIHDPHGRRSSYLQTPPLQFSRGHSSKHQPVPRLNYTTHQQHPEPHHAKRSRNSYNASPSRRDQQQWTRHSSPRGGQPPTPERQVPLLGLFDLTMRGERRLGGRSELAAAQLALAHINNQGVIPGHRLVMFHNDTKCDSGSGVDAFFHAIYTSQAKMMILLGAACPEVTESLAAVVHYWNVVQVSFGSVSPALSDRSSFPRFIRTVAPDSSHNAARLSFLTHHSWTTVATISENHDMYTLALNELMPALEAANISLQATVTLSQGDYTEHLHTLKERDCRIFIASFSADLARKVFCQAYHLGMYGADYAWVLSGAAQDRWWGVTAGTNCSAAQLVESVQGAVLVAAHASITGTHASQSGLTNSQFLQEFSRTGQPLTEYVTQTYDAVWAIALALRQLTDEDEAGGGGGQPRSVGHRRHQVQRPALARREVNSARVNKVTRPPRKPDKEGQECSSGLHQLPGNSTRPTMSWIMGRLAKLQQQDVQGRQHRPEPEQRRQYGYHSHGVYSQHQDATTAAAAFQLDTFDYTREDMADRILETMQGLRFRGVSGPISFDCPDRVGVTAFYQIQDGVPVKVALYHPEAEALDLGCPGCRVLVWPGGEVPASRVFKLRVDTIAPAAFVIMSSLAILGTLLALAFLIFNLTYRRLKYIKLSSPRLNNTTVVGCVLVYAAVVLLGLDHATLPAPNCFPVVCTARAYLLSAGFSLAFGSMFTKTYRVHQIFTRSNSAGVVRNKLLKDKQLITLIMVLLAVDVLIVSAWVAVDPMTRHLHNLTLEVSSHHRGVVYQPQVEVCRSEHTSEWLGALYVYKGLLVAVGVYMAWETRHVKIPALNDSQYIGMSVYNVVITSIIVIVAANIIGERTTLAYVIITTLIFTSTTTTLCLLFIPKILTIWRRAEGDPIVESMGLKIQSNTRRLLTEDKREKYYRAEVQNKVYRREMLKLDQELHKLHRWMEAPDSPTSSTRSFDLSKKKGSMSSMTSDTGRVGGEGDVGICDVEGCGGGTGDRGIAGVGEGCGGGRVLGEMLGAPHTQYLQSDDTTVRRVKRERMFRSLHRSLPSLTLGCPPRRPSDTRLPADGAENEGESFGPPQVFFDARRFHEDQEEARRQAEEEEDCDDDDDDEGRSPRLGHFPASPHPLQRSRLVKRSPIKPRMEPEDEGIVDLRYTLNFSTPLLHGVTEADLPFSISTHVQHGPRVSFLDQDAYHSYDSSPEIHKSSLNTCSFSSPEVRRPSRNTFSSTDIRLQIECSGVIPDEKLSPLVEYRVNDLDVLCPYAHSPRPKNQEVLTQPPPGAAAAGGGGGQEVNSSASEVRRYTSNGAVSRRSLAGTANHSARHGKAARRSASRPTSDSTTISNAARSSGHIFSAVIVHHVANVHM